MAELPSRDEVMGAIARAYGQHDSISRLATELGLNDLRMRFCLDELQDDNLVLVLDLMGTYELTRDGRAYIVKHNLDRE